MDPITIALAFAWVLGGTALANAQLDKPKRPAPKPPYPATPTSGHRHAENYPR